MSLTKLSLAGNILIILNQGEFAVSNSDIPAGDGKNKNLFLQCITTGPANLLRLSGFGQAFYSIFHILHKHKKN
jgi:hypothetical protein